MAFRLNLLVLGYHFCWLDQSSSRWWWRRRSEYYCKRGKGAEQVWCILERERETKWKGEKETERSTFRLAPLVRGRVKRGGESLDLFWNGSLCTAHGKRIAFAIAAAGPRLFCAWMLLFVVFPSEREGKKDTCNVFSNDRNAVINDSSLYITLFETGTRRPTATWDYTARTTNESPRPSTAANTNSESALTISTVRTSLCILSFLFCFFFPRRLSCSRIYGRLRALPAGMIETGRAKHSSSRPHPFLLPCDEEGKELWAHFKFVFHPIRFAVWKMPFQNARRKLVSPSTWKKKHFVCKRRPCNWHAVAGWVTKYRSCVKTSFLSLSFLF